jgi:hypothetical protein
MRRDYAGICRRTISSIKPSENMGGMGKVDDETGRRD